MVVHYSPRFDVALKTGAFRQEADSGPWTQALRLAAAGPPPPAAPAPPPPVAEPKVSGDAKELQSLVERFRKDGGKVGTGAIPVQVTVPDFGPSFFAAAELTAELQAPVIELSYKRTER
jgi:hypothetical protein